VLLHYDGSSWTKTKASVTGMWAMGASDLFAVTAGEVKHFNGTDWATMYTAPYLPEPNGGPPNYRDLWGSSASNLWVVGSQQTITHYNGETFATTSDLPGGLFTIWGTSPSDVLAAGSQVILRHRCQ
jgi:hypothetical protein